MGELTVQVRLHAEQVRQLYWLSRFAYVGTLLNSSILVFALWGMVSTTLLGAWLCAISFVTGARFLLYRSYVGLKPPDGDAGLWGRRFAIGSGAAGLLWGAAGSVLYPAASWPHQFLLIFLIGGMVVVSMVVLAPVRQAFLAFVLPAVTLLTLTVLAQGTPTHFFMGLLMIVFLAVLMGTAPVVSEMMRDALRVKFDNAALVEQLSHANRELSGRIADQQRAEQRLQTEHAVTRILADARTVEEVLPQVIRAIAEASGWVYGARWALDKATNVLNCVEVWHAGGRGLDAFETYNRGRTQSAGASQGPIHQVWASNAPVWIVDIARDGGTRRAPEALKAGLRSVFAFPILIGEEFYGVIEFFAREPREPDPQLMQVTRIAGSQIGQFMARKAAEQNLQFVASHDPLTGLFNRGMFHERLQQALAQAVRFDRSLSLLFIDLDGFKAINDTLGHNAGDAMLAEIANRLRATLREGDVIGRMGGDEFVVLIEEFETAAQVAEVAKKVLEQATRPFVVQGRECQVTSSIGICIYPDDGKDAQTLLKNADAAMYQVKQQGKNSFRFYSPQMNVHLLERLSLEASLKRAVERGELMLLYQPKVSVRGGHMSGVEALLRWEHPTQGVIGPAEFVPVAEDAGLMVSIGEWALHAVCRQARAWREQGLPSIRISVNLSHRQLLQDGLLPVVREALHHSAIDPAQLEVEVTEEMVIRNTERSIRVLAQLKALGVRVVLDDFGVGYSSLNLLQRLPIDSVKIDRSLILGLPRNDDAAALTRAVIAMVHSLGITATAEGVETREQWEFLRELGCEEMQGNYFSSPIPAEGVAGIAREPAGSARRGNVQTLRPLRTDGSAET